MNPTIKNYRVGLVLSASVNLPDYEISVGGQKFNICFYNDKVESEKFCDLIVTDKHPNELTSAPKQQSECHGVVLILNQFSNSFNEHEYSKKFTKAKNIKYREEKLNPASLQKLITSEVIKEQVKENKLFSLFFFFSKHTRGVLFSSLFKNLFILLFPFALILVYYIFRQSLINNGHGTFLCWFVTYEPDCKFDWLEELQLIALIYAIFNLIVYFLSILDVYGNINSDVFEYSKTNKFWHKLFQIIGMAVLFISALILFKSIFVFKNSFAISTEYIGLNFGLLIDKYLPFFQTEYLIYYFLSIDVFLLVLSLNFFHANKKASNSFTSVRQLDFLNDAKKSFIYSIVFTVLLILIFAILPNALFDDKKTNLSYQIIILQGIYLAINIYTIINDFKHK